jgi:hypothetical protein
VGAIPVSQLEVAVSPGVMEKVQLAPAARLMLLQVSKPAVVPEGQVGKSIEILVAVTVPEFVTTICLIFPVSSAF